MTADARVMIIGAGQAGLATGYHLQELGVDFTILADDERIDHVVSDIGLDPCIGYVRVGGSAC